eukprot:10838876-Heterocapsa_arctica.AAC.1
MDARSGRLHSPILRSRRLRPAAGPPAAQPRPLVRQAVRQPHDGHVPVDASASSAGAAQATGGHPPVGRRRDPRGVRE